MSLTTGLLRPLVHRVPGLTRFFHRLRMRWLVPFGPVTLGVRGLVIDGGGRVLLVRHSYCDGWSLPGGAVARRETVQAALARELAEEVGVQAVAIGPLQGLYANLRHGASDHVAVFPVIEWRGPVRADGVEVVAARFFPLDDLPADASPATCRRIAEFRGERSVDQYW